MAATDQFPSQGTLISGITQSVLVTPSGDVTDLTYVTRALHCNVAGNVAVLMAGDTVSVVKAVNAGVTYPWRVRRVLQTGTTATVVAEY